MGMRNPKSKKGGVIAYKLEEIIRMAGSGGKIGPMNGLDLVLQAPTLEISHEMMEGEIKDGPQAVRAQ